MAKKNFKKMEAETFDLINGSIDNLIKCKEDGDSLLSFFFENESRAYLRMALKVGLIDYDLFNTLSKDIKVALKVGTYGEK